MTKLEFNTCRFADQIPGGKTLLFVFSVFIVQSFLFSLPLTILVVGGILFHELGHSLGAQYNYVGVKGTYVFPWLGGVCIHGRCSSIKGDVMVTSMGPVFSVVLSLALFVLGTISGKDIYMAGTCLNAWFTLINLRPVGQRDGMKMLRAVFSKEGKVGLSVPERATVLFAYVAIWGTSFITVIFSLRRSFVTDLDTFYAPVFVYFVKFISMLVS